MSLTSNRARTGLGQHVDMALLDVMVGTLANQALNYLVSGVALTRLGNVHPMIARYETFRTGTGEFVIAVGSDAQFAGLRKVLGLDNDERFVSNASGVAHRSDLRLTIEVASRHWDREALIIALTEAGVPAGRSTTWRRCSPICFSRSPIAPAPNAPASSLCRRKRFEHRPVT